MGEPAQAAPGFPMEVDLGPNGGLQTFGSPEAVESWVVTEEAAWNWFPKGQSSEFEERYRNRFLSLKTQINQFRQARKANAQPTPEQAVKPIKIGLQSFSQKGYFHSSRPEAKFLGTLAQQNSAAAAHAWVHLAGAPPMSDLRQASHGVARAVIFELGLSPDLAASQRAALDDVLSAARKETEALRRERGQLSESAKTALAQFESDGKAEVKKGKEAADSELATFKEHTANAREEFAKLVQDSKEELTALTHTYDVHMSLASAVDYWRQRQRSHVWRAIGFGTATLLAGIVGFEASFRFALSIFAEKGATAKPQYWEVGAVLLVLTVVLLTCPPETPPV